MRKALRIRNLAVLIAGLMVVFGCGSLPTGPDVSDVSMTQTDAPAETPTRVSDSVDASSEGNLPIRGIEVPEPVAPPTLVDLWKPPVVPTPPTGVSRTVRIYGLLGGIVKAGKFTVIIPPLAINGQAMVTVSQPDLSKLEVDLDITPASANRFRLPVLLIGDASSMPRELLSISTIQWWDTENGVWVNVPGATVSLLNLTVTAPLWHFSKYRIEGRAGW